MKKYNKRMQSDAAKAAPLIWALCVLSKRMKIALTFLFLVTSSFVTAADFVLTSSSIGDLQLKKNELISLDIIKAKFPGHRVTHGIGSGDSPDFHYIGVSSKSGELIFSIKSFLDDETNESSERYDLDLLEVNSSKIVDEFGIRVGDRIASVIEVRGKNLNLSANHHDNSIGKDLLFYQFEVSLTAQEIEANYGVNYKRPEEVTLEEAIEKNPIITSISWPRARW
jgi:hypothetical protein